MRPMEDTTKLESMLVKEDAGLFVFGNHNKKRPGKLERFSELRGNNCLIIFITDYALFKYVIFTVPFIYFCF